MGALSIYSQNWPLKQKKEEVKTWCNSLTLPSWNWWLQKFKESPVGTIVKRGTVSKLTRMSFSWTQRVSSVCMKSSAFLTWCRELPRCGSSRQAKYFYSLYVGALVVMMMGFRGTPALWISGNPYNLGGLKPCGCSLAVFSESEDSLMRWVVHSSTDCVGSLGLVSYKLYHPAVSQEK